MKSSRSFRCCQKDRCHVKSNYVGVVLNKVRSTEVKNCKYSERQSLFLCHEHCYELTNRKPEDIEKQKSLNAYRYIPGEKIMVIQKERKQQVGWKNYEYQVDDEMEPEKLTSERNNMSIHKSSSNIFEQPNRKMRIEIHEPCKEALKEEILEIEQVVENVTINYQVNEEMQTQTDEAASEGTEEEEQELQQTASEIVETMEIVENMDSFVESIIEEEFLEEEYLEV